LARLYLFSFHEDIGGHRQLPFFFQFRKMARGAWRGFVLADAPLFLFSPFFPLGPSCPSSFFSRPGTLARRIFINGNGPLPPLGKLRSDSLLFFPEWLSAAPHHPRCFTTCRGLAA